MNLQTICLTICFHFYQYYVYLVMPHYSALCCQLIFNKNEWMKNIGSLNFNLNSWCLIEDAFLVNNELIRSIWDFRLYTVRYQYVFKAIKHYGKEQKKNSQIKKITYRAYIRWWWKTSLEIIYLEMLYFLRKH